MRERRFLIDPLDFREGRAFVRGAELHHLTRVLRLRPGDEISVFDGKGKGFRGRIESLDAAQGIVVPGEAEDPAVEPRTRITLLQGIPHGDRMDLIVEKATELGASSIVPVVSERSVVKPRSGGWGRLDRWRRIAISSAKQSGRLIVPEIAEPMAFEAALALAPVEAAPLRIIFHTAVEAHAAVHSHTGVGSHAALDSPEVGPGISRSNSGSDVLILIGPEGGFTEEEFAAAVAAGWVGASLGPRTLRADTAAVAAMTLVLSRAGEMEG